MWGEAGSNQSQLTGDRRRWSEIDSPIQWDRQEHLKHEHGKPLHGGGNGLGETVAGIKHEEKWTQWKDKEWQHKEHHHGMGGKHRKREVVVDGALPPAPVGGSS